jgi:hypothetical protein
MDAIAEFDELLTDLETQHVVFETYEDLERYLEQIEEESS